MDEETKEAIKKIAAALETIAAAISSRTKQSEAGKRSAEARRAKHGTARPATTSTAISRTPSRSRSGNGGSTRICIAAYCDAYKARYGINPIIDGKTQGLARNLCLAVPPERLRELVQAYLQMDDPWFKTRCHDFATFAGSIGKVAVALANGTQDPHERDYWRKVFGDGEGNVYGSVGAHEKNLGGKELPAGESSDVLELLPEHF